MEAMLSAPGEGIPKGDRWEYEPKWDGFRTLVFRDGDDVAKGQALFTLDQRPLESALQQAEAFRFAHVTSCMMWVATITSSSRWFLTSIFATVRSRSRSMFSIT